jgi:hypothetical protein
MTAPLTGISNSAIYAEKGHNFCRCGKAKTPGKTFCRECYYKLSPKMRDRLYESHGYLETYREAIAILDS